MIGDFDSLRDELDYNFPWRVDVNYAPDVPAFAAPDPVGWAMKLPRIVRESWPDLYLRSRGLGFKEYPPDLRMTRDGKHMIALIRNTHGEVCSYQRTVLENKDGVWLKDRKIMRNNSHYNIEPGSSIRLGFVDGHSMGVAESTEDALAAFKRHREVTWSAISARGMARWVPPLAADEENKLILGTIYIFNDNDYVGKEAAVSLWVRCVKLGIDPIIKEPKSQLTKEPRFFLKDQTDCLKHDKMLVKEIDLKEAEKCRQMTR